MTSNPVTKRIFPPMVAWAILAVASFCGLGFFGGCSGIERHKYVFWGEVVTEEPETLQDHWTDCGPFLPDDRSMKMRRGKAGVLRFYKKKHYERSVPVDGELVVYVFKGIDGGIELTEPDYKLIIASEQLNRQRKFDKKDGYSYHIWLDLGEVDLPPESISILAVFTDAKSREQVASGITYTQIGGETTEAESLTPDKKRAETAEKTLESIPDFETLTSLSVENASVVPEDEKEVATINLSDSLLKRMESAPPAEAEAPPMKTAFNFSSPHAIPESSDQDFRIGAKKLTLEDMRTVGSPSSGTNSYFSQGVIDPQKGPTRPEESVAPVSSVTPNLLDSSGSAKVIYQ